jgi:iron complex transport system substrate-binding protein
MKKSPVALPLFVILLFLSPATSTDARIEIIDQSGATVAVDQPIDSLISVHGIGTYYVYALGAGSRLQLAYYVGLRSVSEAPATMLRWEPRLPEILGFGDPNAEELLASDVQLILADAGRHASFARMMQTLGIPVVLYSAETPDAMKEAIDLTASFLGEAAETRASSFRDDYTRIVDTVAEDLSSLSDDDRVRVLFLGTAPTRTLSEGMYQTRLIDIAGGLSVSRDVIGGGWNEVNLEQILRWNPEVIVIAPYGPVQPEDLLESRDWSSIDAVRSGRVHRMPRLIAPIDTPVPDSLLGIVWMASVFYPDRISLDLSSEVERFYKIYYEFTLTEEEIASFSRP